MPTATAAAAPSALRETVTADLRAAIDRRDPGQTLAIVAAAVRLGVDLAGIRRQLEPAAVAFLSCTLSDALRRV